MVSVHYRAAQCAAHGWHTACNIAARRELLPVSLAVRNIVALSLQPFSILKTAPTLQEHTACVARYNHPHNRQCNPPLPTSPWKSLRDSPDYENVRQCTQAKTDGRRPEVAPTPFWTENSKWIFLLTCFLCAPSATAGVVIRRNALVRRRARGKKYKTLGSFKCVRLSILYTTQRNQRAETRCLRTTH
jgi:hypothetical protein